MLTHFGASQQQHTFELAVSLLSKQLCQPTWKLLFVLHYIATHSRLYMPRSHYAKTSLHRAPTAHRPPLTDVNGRPVEQMARLVILIQLKPCLYTSPLATYPAHLKLPRPVSTNLRNGTEHLIPQNRYFAESGVPFRRLVGTTRV